MLSKADLLATTAGNYGATIQALLMAKIEKAGEM